MKKIAPPLASNKKRVLTLSCCCSSYGVKNLQKILKGHFTGIYSFAMDKISFADAITMWAMFYKKKTIKKPHQRIVDKINEFFDENMIVFKAI